MSYQVRVPRDGWRRDKIDPAAPWRGNLAPPTVGVSAEGADEKGAWALGVQLVDQGGVIEVTHAEIQRWVGDEKRGYWDKPALVPPDQIELMW